MSAEAILADWLPFALSPPRRTIYKRLSANDTGATGAHQVGPYLPLRVAFSVAPTLQRDELNPRLSVSIRVVSHGQRADASLIYYNSRGFGGTRNETRLTGFGGRGSAFMDHSNTGAVLVLSFDAIGVTGEAWIAKSLEEEEIIEGVLGPVEPAVVGFVGTAEDGTFELFEVRPQGLSCSPSADSLPREWRNSFPSARELTDESMRRAPAVANIDDRFLARHECEYALFQTVEEFHLLPTIGRGFTFVSDFLALAQTTLQRRKSRAGRSLELHLARVFDEGGVAYSAQAETEPGHRPDFVFPSIAEYRALGARSPLTMLAAKSTLRDRWRQVLREADRIPIKHVFTLDQGISVPQYRDIAGSGIRLVVPRKRQLSYPREIRSQLMSLQEFIDAVRSPSQHL